MTQKIKKYLNKIEQENKTLFFLLYKFYQNPAQSLGGNNPNTLENYQCYGDITHFIANNTFLEFLNLCLEEEQFCKKLDNILLQKIYYFLYDHKFYKETYIPDFRKKDFRTFFSNKAPMKQKITKNYNKYELFCLLDTYSKISFMYNLNITEEQRNNINLNLINHLLKIVISLQEEYSQIYLLPQIEENQILNTIIKDNYTDKNIKNCFLFQRHGKDRLSFQHLVCNNKFLEIIQNNLLEKELPTIIINNILELLEISINLKTYKYCCTNFKELHKIVSQEKINHFNYKKALNIKNQLNEKKAHKKLVKFPTKK